MNDESKLTAFELQMKQFFPEIFELHMLGKDMDKGGAGEKNIWVLVEALLEMRHSMATGTVYIEYSKGRICKLAIKKDLLKGTRPSLDSQTVE